VEVFGPKIRVKNGHKNPKKQEKVEHNKHFKAEKFKTQKRYYQPHEKHS